MTSPILPKPPWAAYVWCDSRHIYLEHPCPEGKAPHIAAYAKTEAGFAKALATIAQCANKDAEPPRPGHFRHREAKPPKPKTRRANKPRPQLREDLREAAQRTLRKMGMV